MTNQLIKSSITRYINILHIALYSCRKALTGELARLFNIFNGWGHGCRSEGSVVDTVGGVGGGGGGGGGAACLHIHG